MRCCPISGILAKSEAIYVYISSEAEDRYAAAWAVRGSRADDMDYLHLAIVLGATFVIVFMVVAGTLTLVAKTEAGRKRRRVLRSLEHSEGRG